MKLLHLYMKGYGEINPVRFNEGVRLHGFGRSADESIITITIESDLLPYKDGQFGKCSLEYAAKNLPFLFRWPSPDRLVVRDEITFRDFSNVRTELRRANNSVKTAADDIAEQKKMYVDHHVAPIKIAAEVLGPLSEDGGTA